MRRTTHVFHHIVHIQNKAIRDNVRRRFIFTGAGCGTIFSPKVLPTSRNKTADVCRTTKQLLLSKSIPKSNFPNHNTIFRLYSSSTTMLQILPEWHSTAFMKHEKTQEKEKWLLTFMNEQNIFRQDPTSGKYKLYPNKGVNEHLDSTAYLNVLKAYSSSKNINNSPQKCEEILNLLERHFNAAIDYHRNLLSKQKYDNVGRGHKQSKYKEELNEIVKVIHNLKPTTECYNEVIRAWSNSKKPIIARAERWFNSMKRNRDYIIRTSTQEASTDRDSSQENEKLYYTYPQVIPNTESYNLMLNLLSKGYSKRKTELMNYANKSNEMLREMIVIQEKENTDKLVHARVQPNTESFNYVLRAITRCKSDPEIATKVMDTLRVMELFQRNADDPDNSVIKPNTMTYCMAIDAFGITALQKAKQVSSLRIKKGNKKDVYYRSIDDENSLDVQESQYSIENPYHHIEKARSILKYMHDLNDFGNKDVVPNNVAYNTIISAYAKIANNEAYTDAPLYAESVLRSMIDLQENKGKDDIAPNSRSYNAVIKSWANAQTSKSGDRAEWWLRRMWNIHNNSNKNEEEYGILSPDVQTYNTAMLAFQKIYQSERAEKLLIELIELEDKNIVTGQNEILKPNSESFCIVIRAWLTLIKSDHHDVDVIHGCLRALKWLSILLEREDSNIHGFSSSPELFLQILQAVKVASLKGHHDKKIVLQIALKTFSMLQKSRHHVDTGSYICLLQIGVRSLVGSENRNGRKKFLQTVITSCCEDGLLSRGFLQTLSKIRRSTSESIEIKQIGKQFFSNWPLPNEWHRNVKIQNLIPSKQDCSFFQE